MAKPANLIGKRFGYLVVKERAENNKNGNTMWLCQCDCGNEKIALGYDLTHGRTVTCGCAAYLKGTPSANRVDIVGKRFGELVVLRSSDERGLRGALKWECKCSCGNIVTVQGSNLKNGHTTSCGDRKRHSNGYRLDLTGRRYGQLVVKSFDRCVGNKGYWNCLCDCGIEKSVSGSDLQSGHTKSCGCLAVKSRRNPKHVTHGMSRKRIYIEYQSMVDRCKLENHHRKRYFDKGISVCEEWVGIGGFEKFYQWAMQNGYSDDLTLDRIDNTGGYSPNNCRWATQKEQQNNKSTNVLIAYNGEVKTLKQWCELLDLPYGTIKVRHRRGIQVPKLFEPVKSRCK